MGTLRGGNPSPAGNRSAPAFHLGPIDLGQLRARSGDAIYKGPVVGEEQQAFAVPVQPAGGIDAGHVDIILEAGLAALGGELREHAVGLVEEQIAEAPAGRT
jgi:hypothetical protein